MKMVSRVGFHICGILTAFKRWRFVMSFAQFCIHDNKQMFI